MQALAGSQAKEPASKTARVEVVGFFMHDYESILQLISRAKTNLVGLAGAWLLRKS